ncbi:hypothetical protein ACELLULO517_03715 [Acidisoma cellulosilytica]|uniref:Antifreeze protein n=1 Tax=Acidisoma cellulosilyticum TaxID=2802395 RepID=A0A963YY22_9PROT|nr:hypothetical protein [Acidisoma cellulosilyticum]MCB8879328.1 hypothetical protein [Acidisoma cellulosilyticum]
MARRKSYPTGLAGLGLAWTVPQVMSLRLAKIARGGKRGAAESQLMVTEKIAAAAVAQGIMARAIMTGSPEKGAEAVTRFYARKVAANKRRLSKG